ncbi:hypothetical protein HQQ88_10110 [Curtobacterium sp. VKM Ac-2861]|uniref:hypothetical protein n=1 Tax=Curtobacterium sp. VKM Ac-2861 TaxID=2739016 RepID=UPI001565A151|nr:hypothetical protein [Curtobacterium sp. VKM Ac-2861]
MTLAIVYLLIAALTTRTESADRTLDLGGYLGFAAATVVICGLVGATGRALSRSASAVHFGLIVGWLILGASLFLLVVLSFVPAAPPWVSWRSFRSFISLLGTPLVYAIAMTTYTVGFAVRDPRHRWLTVVALAVLPGLMITLYGFFDPMS